MLCVVSEDTERVIGERHMATLRDLGSDTTAVRTEDEVIAAAAGHLAGDQRSLPFALIYVFDEGGTTALLAGAAGVPEGERAAPAVSTSRTRTSPGPSRARCRRGVLVEDLDRFGALPSGAWEEPPQQALAVPLPQQDQQRPYGFLVAALNPYRALDDRRGVRRAGGGPDRGRDLEGPRLRGGAGPRRAPRRARPREDRVLHERQPRAAHAADAAARPGRGRARRRAAPLPAAQRWRVEVILRNAQRLLMLVNSLLDFSRLESGRATARFAPVDLARYTTELASMFRSAFERAGLTLEVDCPPLPEPVYVDAEMWAKIVLNLLSNALKFTFEGGIEVRLEEDGGAPRLVVADTGIGIEPAEQARLFERFHRVLGARSRSHEGTGIGLALVAELTGLHGGEVAVESTPGRGSTFTVTVPFGGGHLPADQVVPRAGRRRPPRRAAGFLIEAMRWLDRRRTPPGRTGPPRAGHPAADPGRRRQRRHARVHRAAARRRLPVDTAPDGAARSRARAEPPDLVLTDVMMPGLDGFGLLAALRADPDTSHIPVVMLSARAGEEGTIEGLEAGADDYLVKPFTAASSWPGSGPTSSSTARGGSARRSSAAECSSTRPRSSPGSAAGRSTSRRAGCAARSSSCACSR